ncbi:MAG TPA: NAD(P)H-dependent glycerol-3-phosphate dehydrogenase [Candidatus Binatia bacterium]|nr:NAD(P)H-dependent glycerol-3-phosphate dehydrogenase [Candidatus Binatia bacterium]
MRIAVIGAGGWGTALASLLVSSGHDVCLWVRRTVLCEQLRDKRENSPYLPGISLPEALAYTTSLAEATSQAELLVLAVPSHVMREVALALKPRLERTSLLVSVSKGIEEETLQTMSAVLIEVLGASLRERLAVLSGPSFAAEVARGLPTAVTVAAQVADVYATVQRVFVSSRFRVYTTADVVGVEIGGAVKNVIAIAAGVSDGLGYGHSARAALITRGLAEIVRLAVRLGAEPQTLSGLSGMGDLVLTCTSDLSRNHRVGIQLGKGEDIGSVLQGMTMVAEGVRTCRSVFSLAQRLSVEMPIVEQVYALLYTGKPPRQVVVDLLAREVKPEFPH